jgi:arylsulfatase A-like enzyme
MGRRILFITTDQQRFDALGCNGGAVARTPVLDQLAATGINYTRAHPQNVVCMPSRSTIITGQHVSTHGVWMNGVPLPTTAPSIARTLHDAGYKTSLIGKAHFEPFLDPFLRFAENRLSFHDHYNAFTRSDRGLDELHRGFDHLEFATHGVAGPLHYAKWFRKNYPDLMNNFYAVLDGDLEVNAEGGGDTGAPQVKHNGVSRETYHTDWVADRTISWLNSLDPVDDWFCWMSFPDPHHPWDPPTSELHRVNWRDLDLPDGYVTDPTVREELLSSKPAHWKKWYDGSFVSNYEAPAHWIPASLTPDQVREVNAMAHIENELVDEAIGRVLNVITDRGWSEDLDIIYTTDHGEFQGDYGLLFKGPYHVDSLMRLPLIWRPAPNAAVAPATVTAPVGLISLAATFASIAGLTEPEYVEAPALPIDNNDAQQRGFERVLTEWDSELFGKIVSSRTIHRGGWTCTAYAPGTVHDGSEGELYNVNEDPLQFINRWDDPSCSSLRSDLLDDMWSHLPTPMSERRQCDAPV